MAKADFITSLILLCLGSGVVMEAWRMPRYTEFGTSIWSAPGIVPGMIGLALAAMGLILFLRARSERAQAACEPEPLDRPSQASSHSMPEGSLRVVLAFAFCVIFAGMLVGWVPFMAATFIFVFGFSLTFDLLEETKDERTAKSLVLRGAISAAVALITSYLIATIFQDVFFVRLP